MGCCAQWSRKGSRDSKDTIEADVTLSFVTISDGREADITMLGVFVQDAVIMGIAASALQQFLGLC